MDIMLLPCTGYCKQCCYEYWSTRVFLNCGFLKVYAQESPQCWSRRKMKKIILSLKLTYHQHFNNLNKWLWNFCFPLWDWLVRYLYCRHNNLHQTEWVDLRCLLVANIHLFPSWDHSHLLNKHLVLTGPSSWRPYLVTWPSAELKTVYDKGRLLQIITL